MPIDVTSSDGTVETFPDKPYTPYRRGESTPTPVVEEAPASETVEEPVAPVKASVDDEDDEDDDGDEGGETISRARYEAKTKKMAAKINAKHRQMKETEEMSRELFSERNQLKSELEAALKRVQESESQAAKVSEKTREDFKNDEEWIDYRAELKVAAADRKRADAELQRLQDAKVAKVIERREAFVKTVPDWDETISNFQRLAQTEPALNMGPMVEDFFYEAEGANAILYKLAKKPEKIRELMKMSPSRAVKELWKMDADLTASDSTPAQAVAAETKPISKATAPISPHTATVAPATKDRNKMSYEEYKQVYEAEMRQKTRH